MAVNALSTAAEISSDDVPVADPALDWRDQAICASEDVKAVFFPVGVTGTAAVQIEESKQVCMGCPVRQTCLEYAITTNQEYGIWGGTSEEERRALRRVWRAEQRALRAKAAAERKAQREAMRENERKAS